MPSANAIRQHIPHQPWLVLQTDKVTVLANTVTYLEKLKTEKDQLLERTRELQSVIHRQEQERKRKQGQEQGGEPQSLGE